MLTQLIARNFKRFDSFEIELANAVVFIGPNNSGKTTALQALALWDTGLRQWQEKRGSRFDTVEPVAINLRDITSLNLRRAGDMWHPGEPAHAPPILIALSGEQDGKRWFLGWNFTWASDEHVMCRPEFDPDRPVPDVKSLPRPAFLPPLSGLAFEEPLLPPARVALLLHLGLGGEVLRNLCLAAHEAGHWPAIQAHMQQLFGVTLHAPEVVAARGSIELAYTHDGCTLPIASAGLGQLQTLQLLAFLHARPGHVLLLDEPDAHLEVLRQRQTYQLLVDTATSQGSQLICASHSEVVLNEAIQRDRVVAFLGKPHAVEPREAAQVVKALRDYGYEHYVQAEQKGWVLYVEGSTDLAILQAWAERLNHRRGMQALARPFVHYLNTNVPSDARRHFNAVKQANDRLLGFALFDRLSLAPQGAQPGLDEMAWTQREIENYFATPDVLLAYARNIDAEAPMQQALSDIEEATRTLGENLWSPDRKASEQVLPQVLQRFAGKVAHYHPLSKGHYAALIEFQDPAQIDLEVIATLDRIATLAEQAEMLRPTT